MVDGGWWWAAAASSCFLINSFLLLLVSIFISLLYVAGAHAVQALCHLVSLRDPHVGCISIRLLTVRPVESDAAF